VTIYFKNVFCVCSPPVNPPKEISDVNDKKPSDWDEREKYVYILYSTMLMMTSTELEICL